MGESLGACSILVLRDVCISEWVTAAVLALATAGLDRTEVVIIADPRPPAANKSTVEFVGAVGRIKTEVPSSALLALHSFSGTSSTVNPQTYFTGKMFVHR